jgi:hypothetical protein
MVEESTWQEYLGEDHQADQGPYRTVESEDEEEEEGIRYKLTKSVC